MKKSETVVEINKAMVAFRKEVKQPLKDKKIHFSNQNMYHSRTL
nr:hypothetical protein [Staphylococcus aureus]